MLKAVEWKQKQLFIIDQSKLPGTISKIQLRSVTQAMDAIQMRKVKGGPVLAVLAAFIIYLTVKQPPLAKNFNQLVKETEKITAKLLKLLPTSMDVQAALFRMERCLFNHRDYKLNTLRDILAREAGLILKAYEQAGQTLLQHGQALIRADDCILTCGNPGSLSVPGGGSVLDIIARAGREKNISVMIPETRPYLDGSRLTTLELKQAKVPFTLVSDSAIAHLMQSGQIDIVMVGAERIAMNGDIVAGIGTYGLAMLAYHHRIPVYVCAATTTFDRSLMSGESVTIETLKPELLLKWMNKPVTKPGCKAMVPAYDLTPHKYISALITDLGIVRAPFEQNLSHQFN